MTKAINDSVYGALVEPATLRIERLLQGPIERVWAYLTDSDLRRQWLAAGTMELKPGAPFEFVWRNDELSDPPGRRPDGFPEEHRMKATILESQPPHRLMITWGSDSDVSFELEPRGAQVLLTVIHRRLPDRSTTLNVGAGWHAHLDLLVACLNGEAKSSFWSSWAELRAAYEKRFFG
jgi:uncharacterized protein YndB with AHSA1/START domain